MSEARTRSPGIGRSEMSGDRISFRWGNLWRIFWTSLEELSFGEMFLRMSLVLSISYCSGYEIGTKNMLKPPEPYAPMAWTYYLVSWPVFVLFRYYFLPSHWFLWMKFAASILYGGILGVLISLFYSVSLEQTMIVVICAVISVMVLIGDPY